MIYRIEQGQTEVEVHNLMLKGLLARFDLPELPRDVGASDVMYECCQTPEGVVTVTRADALSPQYPRTVDWFFAFLLYNGVSGSWVLITREVES